MSVLIQGQARIRIVEYTQTTPYLQASVEIIDENYERDVETDALMVSIKNLFQRAVELSPHIPSEVGLIVMNMDDPRTLADLIAANFNISVSEKQEILELIDVKKRLERITAILNKELQVLELGSKIQGELKKEMDKNQREYYLREQMKAIQRELGEDYAIGAYVAGMLTVLGGWHLVPALGASAVCGAAVACAVGFPALRVKGLMLVIATLAFGEGVRLFFFNFEYQIARGDIKVGPLGGEGFRQIRFFPENGWSTLEVMVFVWLFVVPAMALLWWFDRSRYGTVLRAVGEDELAAQSVGINLTAVKVSAMTVGGAIAGVGGGLFAHYTTHIEHIFGVSPENDPFWPEFDYHDQ